jgi:histidine triad (HIT) family protein
MPMTDIPAYETHSITECLLCRKHRGKFASPGGAIYADDLVFAGHAHLPDAASSVESPVQYLGWVTIETQRHVPDLSDLSDDEGVVIGQLAARLSRAIRSATGAEHIYAFVIGHEIAHVHLHLLPRYPGTPREYWGQRVDEWPDAPRGGAEAIAALCERIRSELLRS